MNTTIRYWFPDTIECKYMSFKTYSKALNAIELFKQIDVKSTLYSTIFPQLLTTIPHVFPSILYTFQHTCGKEIHLAPLFIRPFLIHFKAYLSLFVIVFHRNTPKLWKTKGQSLFELLLLSALLITYYYL